MASIIMATAAQEHKFPSRILCQTGFPVSGFRISNVYAGLHDTRYGDPTIKVVY